MSTTNQRYRGFKPYSIDSKFRVSVTPAWRPAPGATIYLLFSRTHEMPMIKVLTQDGYDERVEIVEKSNLSEGKKREKLGVLASLCREASINDQGKLLVPKDLSELAEIAPDSEVVLVGREKHFEIWNSSNHAKALAIEMNQDDEDDLGIF